MKDLTFKCWAKAQYAKQRLKMGAKSFLEDENGGADSIIIAIVIIVIVLAIAFIFRDQIGQWVSALFKAGTDTINNNDVTSAAVTTYQVTT